MVDYFLYHLLIYNYVLNFYRVGIGKGVCVGIYNVKYRVPFQVCTRVKHGKKTQKCTVYVSYLFLYIYISCIIIQTQQYIIILY